MAFSFRKLFGFKGDTKREFADKYISRLNAQAKDDLVEVTTSLVRLQDEVQQFKETVDKISKQFPGQQKKI